MQIYVLNICLYRTPSLSALNALLIASLYPVEDELEFKDPDLCKNILPFSTSWE